MFDWSNDDEVLTTPPLSTTEPPRSVRARDQSRGGEESHEPLTSGIPEQRVEGVTVQRTTEVPSERTTAVPEQPTEADPGPQAQQRLTEEEPRVPPQSMRVDPTTTPRGSGRHRRFKKLNRQTKP